MKRAASFVPGRLEHQHRTLIDEAAIHRFVSSVLLRLAVIAFATAVAAHTSSHSGLTLNDGDQQAGRQTTAVSIR
jgi:hypothetical protein